MTQTICQSLEFVSKHCRQTIQLWKWGEHWNAEGILQGGEINTASGAIRWPTATSGKGAAVFVSQFSWNLPHHCTLEKSGTGRLTWDDAYISGHQQQQGFGQEYWQSHLETEDIDKEEDIATQSKEARREVITTEGPREPAYNILDMLLGFLEMSGVKLS